MGPSRPTGVHRLPPQDAWIQIKTIQTPQEDTTEDRVPQLFLNSCLLLKNEKQALLLT